MTRRGTCGPSRPTGPASADFHSFRLRSRSHPSGTTGSVLALVDNPMQRERLVADDTLLPSVVEELLRWVSPIMQFR